MLVCVLECVCMCPCSRGARVAKVTAVHRKKGVVGFKWRHVCGCVWVPGYVNTKCTDPGAPGQVKGSCMFPRSGVCMWGTLTSPPLSQLTTPRHSRNLNSPFLHLTGPFSEL